MENREFHKYLAKIEFARVKEESLAQNYQTIKQWAKQRGIKLYKALAIMFEYFVKNVIENNEEIKL